MTDADTDPRPHRPMLAIGLRLIAVVCLSVMFVSGRLAAGHGVNIIEIVFYRQLIAMPVVFVAVLMTSGAASLRPHRIGVHATRMITGVIGMGLNFLSYILLPPAEAATIGFTMPIFGTILSALVLREATGIHRWSAVLLGFAGVLIMIRPDSGHFPMGGVLVAIAAAILTAIISLILRELGRTNPPGVTVFWFTVLSMGPLGVIMPFFAQGHDGFTWGLLLVIGIVGGVAQLCMTAALRFGPVATVLPMDYSAIIWTTLLGAAIGEGWPLATTWIGAILIIASGLYIAWREHVRAVPPIVSPAIPPPD